MTVVLTRIALGAGSTNARGGGRESPSTRSDSMRTPCSGDSYRRIAPPCTDPPHSAPSDRRGSRRRLRQACRPCSRPAWWHPRPRSPSGNPHPRNTRSLRCHPCMHPRARSHPTGSSAARKSRTSSVRPCPACTRLWFFTRQQRDRSDCHADPWSGLARDNAYRKVTRCAFHVPGGATGALCSAARRTGTDVNAVASQRSTRV